MGSTFGYLGERLITFAATVLISLTVVFFVPRLVPGDPLGAIFANLAQGGGSSGISDELQRDFEERFGLDKSLPEQYFTYLGDLAQGDLGYSIPNVSHPCFYTFRECSSLDYRSRRIHDDH